MEIRTAAGKAMLEEDKVLRAGYLSDRLRGEEGAAREPETDAPGTRPEPRADTDVILAALRKHRFRVAAAEEQLGYSHKSKTLSNYLRGICMEALSRHDLHPGAAAASLVKTDDPATVAKLRRKMERYLKTVADNVARNTEQRLFKNLPSAYHEPLRRMIENARRDRTA